MIDTFVAAAEETFANEQAEIDGIVLTSDSDIAKYYRILQTYFEYEDTIQIFGAAYDDAQWVVLEWLEAIKFIRQYNHPTNSRLGLQNITNFAHRAHIFYDIVQNQFDKSLCNGGIIWNPTLAPYKNAITNELYIATSVAMYLYSPGDDNIDPYPSRNYLRATNNTLPDLQPLTAHDPQLLQNAITAYEWFITHNFTNAQGLIVDGFHVTENQTTCDQRNEMVYTYNQGVILSGLRDLWQATGNVSYLADGYHLVDTVINATGWSSGNWSGASSWAGLGRHGIMEDYCDASATCAQDNLIFKGVYFQHLHLFCQALPTTTPLVPGLTHTASAALAAEHARNCIGYVPWVEHNARAALGTRNSSGLMGEWWGATVLNETHGPNVQWAVSTPVGSTDVWNQPWLLTQPPWNCVGQAGCRRSPLADMRRAMRERRRADQQHTRTVETQAQGLAVINCAADLIMAYGKEH